MYLGKFMQSNIKILSLLSFFVATSAFGAKEFNNVTIKDVIVNMDSGIHFRINEDMANNESCANSSWFKIEPASTYEKEALSLLLSYEAQKKPITVYISGCTGGYPKLKYIY